MSNIAVAYPGAIALPDGCGPSVSPPGRGPQDHIVANVTTSLKRVGWLRYGEEVVCKLVEIGGREAVVTTDHPLNVGDAVSVTLPDLPEIAAVTRDCASQGVVYGRVVAESESENGRGALYQVHLAGRVRHQIDRLIPWVALLSTLLVMVNVVMLKTPNLFYFWYHPLINTYSLVVSFYILSRIVLAGVYKPPVDSGERPPVTVIIACMNEEASIGKTIERVFRSDYPPDRVEVIAVDDGSTDGTFREMERMRGSYPKLKVVRFEKNRGKRHAMAVGSRMASGEVLVFVDSDTYLRRDALAKMAGCFKDPEIGAVCGHANVSNASVNLLTKMQEVRYYIAFRVLKAAESVLSAVSCCSGCLAAYRRQYVMDVLDIWLDQRFLGTPATFGDDRSLTNYMLRKYRVIYHSEAICTTDVPEKLGKFLKQQLRWKKSWVRESLIACTFLWKRHPLAAFFFYMGVLFPLVAPAIVFHALALPLIGLGSFSFLYVYGSVLMSTLYALLYLIKHRNSLWIFGVVFAVFYMLFLVWQTYYALITLRRNHWGTR